MGTTINININGFGVSQTQSPDPSRTYTLLPGFSPVREMFGERKIKAKKKKKCSNGQVCGFSCISKTKTCTANMTAAEFKAHNAAKRAEKKAAKAAKSGGGAIGDVTPMTTQQRMDAVEASRQSIMDVDSLNVAGIQSKYSDQEIKTRAEAIAEAGSFIRPVIVEQAGNQLDPTFNVVDGELTAIAYQQAKEINPNVKARTVIVNDQNREYITEQLGLSKSIKREPIQSASDGGSKLSADALDGITTPRRFDIADIATDYKVKDSEKELVESLARNYVKGDGPITPLILKSTGINTETFSEQFTVQSGRLEFLAAQRARELDPTFGQVKAIQLNEQNEAAIARQTQEI